MTDPEVAPTLRDPDETDTAHHPFVPSQADSAFCDVCGEARNWHPLVVAPLPSTSARRVDAIVLVDMFRDACRDMDTISWRDTSYDARSRAWSDAREALLQRLFEDASAMAEAQERERAWERAGKAALGWIMPVMEGFQVEQDCPLPPEHPVVLLRALLAPVESEGKP